MPSKREVLFICLAVIAYDVLVYFIAREFRAARPLVVVSLANMLVTLGSLTLVVYGMGRSR